jgi:serine/threonine-protein kinase
MKPGTLIAGKYRLKKPLGDGAMGLVWSAVNERTEREVALKLLHSSDADMRRRLLREAKACGRLSHRTIVEIYDVGETDEGEPFLVMQLLNGETLGSFMKREGKLSSQLAAGIALDVARALAVAHDAGVVHRDLKPANIFLHRDGDVEGAQVKVLDFGVSKMALDQDGLSSASGSLIGSPAYMSPEQAKTEKIDGRADLWSLGVVLYEMLAGERPFKSAGMVNVLSEILLSKIPRVESVLPGVDKRLADVVARCLERDLDKRVQSAAELTSLLAPFTPPERYSHSDGMRLASGSTSALSLQKEVEEDAYSVDEYAPTAVFRRGDLRAGREIKEEAPRRGPDSGLPTIKRAPQPTPVPEELTTLNEGTSPKPRLVAKPAASPKDSTTTSTSPVSRPPAEASVEPAPALPPSAPTPAARRRYLVALPVISAIAFTVFLADTVRNLRASSAVAPVASPSALSAGIESAATPPLPESAQPPPPPASTEAQAASAPEPSASAPVMDPAIPAGSASAKRLWGKMPGASTAKPEPSFKLLFPMPGDQKKK